MAAGVAGADVAAAGTLAQEVDVGPGAVRLGAVLRLLGAHSDLRPCGFRLEGDVAGSQGARYGSGFGRCLSRINGLRGSAGHYDWQSTGSAQGAQELSHFASSCQGGALKLNSAACMAASTQLQRLPPRASVSAPAPCQGRLRQVGPPYSLPLTQGGDGRVAAELWRLFKGLLGRGEKEP